MSRWCVLCVLLLMASAAQAGLREDAAETMRRAAEFCDTHVSAEGGYLWRYTEDLSKREGEGEVGPTTVWVQPPGTPAVGLMYLRCYEVTGDRYYLWLAQKAGDVLVRGQMQSGGWAAQVELAVEDRPRYRYRVQPALASKKARNISSFDDNQTQSALRLLMRLDAAMEFKDTRIHEAATYALDNMIDAQYPSGGWPQVFDGELENAEPEVLRASFPDEWSRKYTGHNRYWRFYTLNDRAMLDTIEVMFEAGTIYDEPRYKASAVKACDFLLLAQLPEPQPAWAQQYDFDMHPCWARKFEPPAVTGGESQDVMLTLIDAYQHTGDRKYLEPIPKALAYFKASRLPDGRLARFYEMKTNRPLYFTRDYDLAYDSEDAPKHYSFTVSDRLDKIERAYERAKSGKLSDLRHGGQRRVSMSDALAKKAQETVNSLNARGAWLSPGPMKYAGDAERVIDMAHYIERMNTLADYLEASGRE